MSSSALPIQGEKISLYYKDGSSDKVYHAQIESTGDGLYTVNFQYGRRGAALQTGTKTQTAVTFDKAKKIYDKLVAEKTGKGYTQGEDGTPYQGSDKAGQQSGLVPQLLNFIGEKQVKKLISDDDWIMQEKMDGVRCMIKREGDEVIGSNRRGLCIALPDLIVADIKKLSCSEITLDGERIGDKFYVFDVLSYDGKSLRDKRAAERFALLITKVEVTATLDKSIKNVIVVRCAYTTDGKQSLYQELEAAKAEGVVFKKKDAEYVPGRPNSGGNQVKFKFYATATLFVSGVNDKRSVQIAARTGKLDQFQQIGNVTIPTNHEIPKYGDLVEVRYLYWYTGGSLFQPTYLGKREDKTEADLVSTLKPKPVDTDDETGEIS